MNCDELHLCYRVLSLRGIVKTGPIKMDLNSLLKKLMLFISAINVISMQILNLLSIIALFQ